MRREDEMNESNSTERETRAMTLMRFFLSRSFSFFLLCQEMQDYRVRERVRGWGGRVLRLTEVGVAGALAEKVGHHQVKVGQDKVAHVHRGAHATEEKEHLRREGVHAPDCLEQGKRKETNGKREREN